jgi:hypothetical protein
MDRFGIRAKSEFCPRTAANSTSNTGSDYPNGVGSTSGATSGADGATSGPEIGIKKDNLIVTAAKRWASYDKPTYQTPFTRDNWKRSHRKFNYSRFLNYTRETVV